MTSRPCNCCLGGFDSQGYACQYCYGTGWIIDCPSGPEREDEKDFEEIFEKGLDELAG